MTLPEHVRIVEVGARDGLQNEPQSIPPNVKAKLVSLLTNAGLKYIEAGSFVNPKWVPQMAGSDEVFSLIDRKADTTYAALTPNMQGFERALAAGADEVAVFASASEGFSHKNINCSISESLTRFEPVIQAAQAENIKVRGYLSCVIACPYDGETPAIQATNIARQLIDLGCYEVSLGDTIGVGTPASVNALLEQALKQIPANQFAVHFHDTYGMAIANIVAALQYGIAVIDSSVAGLGGCPYANGASGNVATEDVVYLLDGLGIQHGVDFNNLLIAGDFINQHLGRKSASKVALAKHA